LHPEYLFDPSYFYERFVSAKDPDAVVFAAIVGVPYGDQDGADACQGQGSQLGDCLDQEEMQLVQEQPGIDDDPPNPMWLFRPACARTAGELEVTRAYPGRRYVELAAEHFGDMGYVSSICNADWSPAMAEIARLVSARMLGDCFETPLAWDSVNKVAECDVVVAYANEGEECPAFFGDGVEPVVEHQTNNEGEEVVLMYCPIPKIPYELECADQVADLDHDVFGWYYCENTGAEDFPEACQDGIDDDADGLTDCDDEGCADCVPCPGATGVECAPKCKNVVMLTEEAKTAVAGRAVFVQCPR
jgi:hypothetical protein